MHLTDSDLKFLVETVATQRRDHDHVINLIRDKDDLLEPMLEDPKLAERLVNEPETFACLSPYLMFNVLLRCARRDLESRSFVFDRDTRGKRLPVFEAAQAGQLLGEPAVREYLAKMLCSFVRTHTGQLCWQEGRAWRRRRFSDLDMDDMIALCQMVEAQFKPRLYKRIADIALFLTGIYPEHTPPSVRRSRHRAAQPRSVPDYERDGRRFYSLAAQETEPPGPASVFEKLSEKFTLAREALNTLSERYLKPLRERYFQAPAG